MRAPVSQQSQNGGSRTDQYSVLICLLLTNDTRVILKRKFCFVKESFAFKKKVLFSKIKFSSEKESFVLKKKILF